MLKKVVLPIIAISGMIFASFAILLAQYGSERLEVEMDNQELFNGEVRDIFSPGMGAAFSLTVGIGSIVVIGYGKSLRRKDKLEKQLLFVKKAILDKDFQIEQLRKSDIQID